MVIAVTADIVGSRQLVDRGSAQRTIERAIARADADGPAALRALAPTVGDEFQGVYADLEDALAAILLLRLALPDGIDCRFGVGIGEIGTVASETSAGIPDGPGWWAARAAIETIHAIQARTVPGARTWVAVADDASDELRRSVRVANAGLLARDQLVSGMTERARRITYGRCTGATQSALAGDEGISQPAVSQLLASSGGSAVAEAYRVLVEG